MTVAEWVSSASVLVVLALLAVVVADRARMKQRLANAEGAVTGLGLDLEAMAERVAELQSYLRNHESWAVDASAPATLTDPSRTDRWTRRDVPTYSNATRRPADDAEQARVPESAARAVPTDPTA